MISEDDIPEIPALTSADLDLLTYSEIISLRDSIITAKHLNHEILISCKAQIDAAKARWDQDGTQIDSRWFAAANTRAKYAGQEDQRLANLLGDIRRQMHTKRSQIPAGTTATTTTGIEPNPVKLLAHALSLIQQAIDLIKLPNPDNKETNTNG